MGGWLWSRDSMFEGDCVDGLVSIPEDACYKDDGNDTLSLNR